MASAVFVLSIAPGAAPPSPLDALDPKRIPLAERTADLAPETVAILGSNRGRHSEPAKCIDVSPDGRLVVTGSRDGTVRVWDAADLHELQTLRGHEADVDVGGIL